VLVPIIGSNIKGHKNPFHLPGTLLPCLCKFQLKKDG